MWAWFISGSSRILWCTLVNTVMNLMQPQQWQASGYNGRHCITVWNCPRAYVKTVGEISHLLPREPQLSDKLLAMKLGGSHCVHESPQLHPVLRELNHRSRSHRRTSQLLSPCSAVPAVCHVSPLKKVTTMATVLRADGLQRPQHAVSLSVHSTGGGVLSGHVFPVTQQLQIFLTVFVYYVIVL
jgi:hypothetical protein